MLVESISSAMEVLKELKMQLGSSSMHSSSVVANCIKKLYKSPQCSAVHFTAVRILPFSKRMTLCTCCMFMLIVSS